MKPEVRYPNCWSYSWSCGHYKWDLVSVTLSLFFLFQSNPESRVTAFTTIGRVRRSFHTDTVHSLSVPCSYDCKSSASKWTGSRWRLPTSNHFTVSTVHSQLYDTHFKKVEEAEAGQSRRPQDLIVDVTTDKSHFFSLPVVGRTSKKTTLIGKQQSQRSYRIEPLKLWFTHDSTYLMSLLRWSCYLHRNTHHYL